MSSLQPRLGHWLLRCPLCKSGFSTAAGAFVCRNKHGIDLARAGYVNLLRNGRRRPAVGGDSLMQLRQRAEFLDAGHFDAITTTIIGHVGHSAPGPWRVLDAGSGTGHHLARIAEMMSGPVIGLGLDISKEAARQAVRRWPSLAFAVADLWTEWPVHDAAVDLVISIFAPKNFSETARVLRPGGWLALVYPGADHMTELRDRFGLIRRHEPAPQRYTESIQRSIGSPTAQRLCWQTVLDDAAIRSAILMGPNARHIAASVLDAVHEPIAVTFDVIILLARKK